MSTPTLVEFTTDPAFLALSLSPAQEALLRAVDAMPLRGEHLDLYRQCTGRTEPPHAPFPVVTVAAGARSGKDSRVVAPVTLHEIVFGGHADALGKGEHATVPVVMPTQRQTRITFGYLRDYVLHAPLLASQLAEPPTATEIKFANRITVTCFPCTTASLRGWSIPVACMNELAFYRVEGQADSDVEVQASIRRGMVGFPAPRLLKVSTPYMRGGVLYGDVQRAWGQPDPDLLVWKAPTALMNPTITSTTLDRERRLDPTRFAREFEAEFADDVATFLPHEWIDTAVTSGVFERAPVPSLPYIGAVDPSGGGPDAFTLAVVHVEGGGDLATARVVVDVVRGRGRIGKASPDLVAVVREYAEVLRAYQCREVVGDRYAGAWVRQAFAEAGLRYVEAPWDRSAAYLALEPLFAQGRIDLIDHPRLARELKWLERRPRPGGRDRIDHPVGQHDDHGNALALAVAKATERLRPSELVIMSLDTGEYRTLRQGAERRRLIDAGLGDLVPLHRDL